MLNSSGDFNSLKEEGKVHCTVICLTLLWKTCQSSVYKIHNLQALHLCLCIFTKLQQYCHCFNRAEHVFTVLLWLQWKMGSLFRVQWKGVLFMRPQWKGVLFKRTQWKGCRFWYFEHNVYGVCRNLCSNIGTQLTSKRTSHPPRVHKLLHTPKSIYYYAPKQLRFLNAIEIKNDKTYLCSNRVFLLKDYKKMLGMLLSMVCSLVGSI